MSHNYVHKKIYKKIMTKNILHFQAKISAKLVKKKTCIILGKTMGLHVIYRQTKSSDKQ